MLPIETMKRKVKVCKASIYNIEQLYCHLLVMSQSRDFKLSKVFKCEFTPVLYSIFYEYDADKTQSSPCSPIDNFATYPFGLVEAKLVDGNET